MILLFQSNKRGSVEESLRSLNTAATTIQRWYRRHMIRHQAERAAVRRLMSQKREDILRHSLLTHEQEQNKQEERKRTKEERERQSRLDAIKVTFYVFYYVCVFPC